MESGWEGVVSQPNFAPYLNRKDELTMHHGILMWGNRVIVPTKLRGRVTETLHEGHMGTVKMKGLARGYVWWPRMDEDIEDVTKRCEGCQSVANNPKQAPLHRWQYPAYPWQRLHIDFAGPFQGEKILVVVDAHTKWPDIFLDAEHNCSRNCSYSAILICKNGSARASCVRQWTSVRVWRIQTFHINEWYPTRDWRSVSSIHKRLSGTHGSKFQERCQS